MAAVTETSLRYMINHVFLPPKLPEKDDLDLKMEHALCIFTHQAAATYCHDRPEISEIRWEPMLKMLKNMCSAHRSHHLSTNDITRSLNEMKPGDVYSLLIRAQNAGVIIRKTQGAAIFETFEVSPQRKQVMVTEGKLLCSYPGPSITVPDSIFSNSFFLEELSSFLTYMNVDDFESYSSTHPEDIDTPDPQYITELLTGILRGMGQPTEVIRIRKRIGDEVLSEKGFKPWRRSSIWLVIRVALQTSLSRGQDGHGEYKSFMIFLMAQMMSLGVDHGLPSDLLFCIRTKMSRRLYKLGSIAPNFVTHYVRRIGDVVQEQLEGRWLKVQTKQSIPAHWVPEELDFTLDTTLSFTNSQNYLSNVLQKKFRSTISHSFGPDHAPRILNFDSFSHALNLGRGNVFEENSYIALADFELAVQEGMDGWISQNLHSSSGCTTISSCITQYHNAAYPIYSANPENMSLMLLTIMDLWVGLDKLAVAQCPLLAEYSPEIPSRLLEPLLIRKAKSLKRLESIEEYVRNRHSPNVGGMSIFTNDINAASFSVRFFDQSAKHVHLLSRITRDATQERDAKLRELSILNARHKSFINEASLLEHEHLVDDGDAKIYDFRCQKCSLTKRASDMKIEVHKWPLSSDLSEAKATVFELQLPTVFGVWRMTTYMILRDISKEFRILKDTDSLQSEATRFSRETDQMRSDVLSYPLANDPLEKYAGDQTSEEHRVFQDTDSVQSEATHSRDTDDMQSDVLSSVLANNSSRENYTGDQTSEEHRILQDTDTMHFKAIRSFRDTDEMRLDVILLANDPRLKKYAGDRTSRITFARPDGSFLSREKFTQIPSTSSRVCFENDLHYILFDKIRYIQATRPNESCNLSRLCTLQISHSSPYKSLQYAVDNTSHTANEVLAHQADCPRDLTLNEFIAFGSLRSGPRLQWLNISREIAARSLNFRAEAVYILLAQAAWQVGPSFLGGGREWHAELDSTEFCLFLLAELQDLLLSIKGNWQESLSARTIITLTTRLLASITDPDVTCRAYNLLREVRNVTYGWIHQLVGILQRSEDPTVVQELQSRVCKIATTCRGTFDVGLEHAPHLLGSRKDVAVLVECAIIIYDNTPPRLSNSHMGLARLLDCDCRLAHSLEPLLFEHICRDSGGIDDAIGVIWSGYRPGGEWIHLNRPNNRWITTTTARGGNDQVSQSVQLNLLDGCLLVNGKPFSRLPKEVVRDPIYSRLFGQKILNVIPSDIPGMDFATRNFVSDYQVFFGSRHTELVIRAKCGPETLELIPHHRFIGDLPKLLIENHVHWLNIDSKEIEIRSLESPWTSSFDNWRGHFSPGGDSKMFKGRTGMKLVDNRSRTMQMISRQLAPLEYVDNLTVTYSPEGHLHVHLPRFGLSFFINKEGKLESQNMPRMLIDADQSSGAMFGLFNQLLLCEKDTENAHPIRRVLIPYGDVIFRREGHHVSVTVDTKTRTRVFYHEYHVNSYLGQLVGTGSLSSRLYKSYLHAVTSHCLPDPLTGRTGTEEALHELCSAGCLSFQSLEPDDKVILRHISALAPLWKRDRSTVRWSDLAITSQHCGFRTQAHAILRYAQRLEVFLDKPEPGPYTDAFPESGNMRLLERASRRNAVYYSEDIISSQQFPGSGDVVHISRDFPKGSLSENERVAAAASAMVLKWPQKLSTCDNLFEILGNWGRISGPNKDVSMHYSSAWIMPRLDDIWISLYNLLRHAGSRSRVRDQFTLAFSLAALAWSSPASRDLIPTILSFTTVTQFSALSPPLWSSYDLKNGLQPEKNELLKIVNRFAIAFENSVDSMHGANTATIHERRSFFRARLKSQAKEIVDHLSDQWPCTEPRLPPESSNSGPWLFYTPELLKRARNAFLSPYQNQEFHVHMEQVQAVLDEAYSSDVNLTQSLVYKFSPCSTSRPSAPSRITFDQLFKRDAPETTQLPSNSSIPSEFQGMKDGIRRRTSGLQSLFMEFQDGRTSAFQKIYGRDLDQSRRSLEEENGLHFHSIQDRSPLPLKNLMHQRDRYQSHFQHALTVIVDSLSPSNFFEEVMFTAGQWPCLTTRSLLGNLTFARTRLTVPEKWIETLKSLAQALLVLQRFQRLIELAHSAKLEEFYTELQNEGYSAQSGMENSDWLLIQVEGNFLARPVQIHLAQEMIAPTLGRNTVFQLNMGEGKSSVIAPMVAAALSDGNKLVRVVVLKPLATQMFLLLAKRLSGLANRRIFYMPFSRRTYLTVRQAQLIQDLYLECMNAGGVLVTQPEHILSFKLMGIDRLLCANSTQERHIATTLLESQRWLDKNSRDILDESDELLYTRYQLVYTVGQQQPLDGHPERWTTIQQVLSLVRKHAPKIQRRFPLGIEIQQFHRERYPRIWISQKNAGDLLIALIAHDIINENALPNCAFGLLPTQRVREAALRFISETVIQDNDAQLLKENCEETGAWKALLLLRGLFVQQILIYVLKERRWRVDYGLDHRRTLLAVPYKAKDVPSLRAEFGHPDVSIALTCLSYYYQGLCRDQVKKCFELLYTLDNPTLEYESWISNMDYIPDDLRHLSGVNTKDPEQLRLYLFPLFHQNHAVVDFFLAQVVFPKEAKQFPQKLATSAWDIAEKRRHVTTGFSGTNDRRYLFPTSIIQDDSIGQLSTSARVMNYLLQPENDHYLPVHDENRQRLSAQDFIHLLVSQTPKIRVLLDVGAQMLELRNNELAAYWLSQTSDLEILAAIYFDDNDELAVLTRDGPAEAFLSSPFNQQLGKCLVYLDDAHTRGTDLPFPIDTRAAVTLGPKVTKDRLLQGCMRMRKLGYGQSVMFFAPLEVERGIRESSGKSDSDEVGVIDILRWTMLETCRDIEHQVPHWAQQGTDHNIQQRAWKKISSFSRFSVRRLKSAWLRPEARTLGSLYGFPFSEDANFTSRYINKAVEVLDFAIRPWMLAKAKVTGRDKIRERCRELGILSFSSTGMEEEQEREVHQEIERVREVERPPRVMPATHQIHVDVHKLVVSGLMVPGSPAFVPILGRSTPFSAPFQEVWSPHLLSTKDFSTTIKRQTDTMGDYLRPVNWIVSCAQPDGTGDLFVALSPYEANHLLPEFRRSEVVRLHQYTPKVTRTMKSFDDLAINCIPPLPRQRPAWAVPRMIKLQLNLWAGQLYLQDYETYLELCNFLGIYTTKLRLEHITVQNDGFVKPKHRGDSSLDSPFKKSPIPFLNELFGLRRKDVGYLSTHMGKILHARPLKEEDFANIEGFTKK